MPTARNARGIDLLAYNANARQYLGIQVKALAKRDAVPLGSKSLEDLLGDWWVIVASTDENPECFIMTPEEVRTARHSVLAPAREIRNRQVP